MKFGQDYQAALSREEYPQDWVDSAISYKKLKKCIKKVQQELIGLGLDKDTLNELWQNVSAKSEELNGHLPGNGTTTTPATEDEHVLHYSLDGSEKVRFAPKLTIAVDPLDGSPVDAWLSPDTRRVLRRLAKKDSVRRASLRASSLSIDDDESTHLRVAPPKGDRADGSDVDSATDNDESRPHHFHTIEIPLTSDSEFFQILQRELAELDHLQSAEQERLHQAISALGNELRELKQSKKKRSKEEIEAWRNIFELYADAEVFSSSHESDAGARDSAHAQKQFESFRKALQPRKSEVLKLGPTASRALERFLHINVNLLRLVKFQEINKTALTKIMKKFDKRTSLHTQATIRNSLTKAPFLAQDLARATCFTITNELISLIPQVNDYLCPICFSISWKPVRLKCNHVFCIRCLIVLQRQQKPHCPLCREEVVMEATNQNIDHELMAFLQANFKKVVKQKQHDNELAAGIDRWGEQYGNSQKCVVM